MKLKNFFSFFWLTIVVSALLFVLGFSAFADDAAAAPIPLGDYLKSVIDAVKSFHGLGVWASAALVVNLLVNATKAEVLGAWFHKLSDAAQTFIVLGLSVISVGVAVLAAGGSWISAVTAVLQSAAGATLLHELWTRWFPAKS
jgi:hypothetical protein